MSQMFPASLSPFRFFHRILLGACLCLALGAHAADQTVKPGAAPAKVTTSQVAKARPDVHVNRASADELAEALIGVGPAKARAIVAWRQSHGAFKSLDDLGQVKGVGPAILKQNKPHILFD